MDFEDYLKEVKGKKKKKNPIDILLEYSLFPEKEEFMYDTFFEPKNSKKRK